MKKELNKKVKEQKAITLIALIVTIVILLILAGVSIAMLTGEKGVLNKAKTASEETTKSQAAEAMNLKITNIQISSYTENQQLPNLQYLADKLCEDNDMEYVLTKSKEHASLAETDIKPKIDVTNFSSIFTKLKEYPYEFEINSALQLASIDGIKIADNNDDGTVTLTQDQYNSILNRLSALENNSSNITTNDNYSTEEQVVGTWIDGKPIYRFCYSFTWSSTDFNVSFSSMGLSDYDKFDKIVKSAVHINSSPNNFCCSEYYFASGDYYGHYILADKKSVQFRCGSSWPKRPSNATFIIEYTKSSD